MSARSVCNGTRPSRYHSIRAISAPPRRPEQLIRIPSAPRRIADCTARFIARRNATRRSSCCAIDSATSVASSSGLRISTMLMTTSDAVISATRLRNLSMSAPFLPITTPGRAEWIVTRHFLCGRSITIRATAACFSSLCRISRILTSSCSSLPYSFLPANQRESHVRLMPRRSPIGLIFSPIVLSRAPLGARLDLTNDDRQLREWFKDTARAATAARCETLHHDAVADMRLGDDQIVDIEVVVVLGVGDRRFQALLDVDRDPLARELQIGERGRSLPAADQLRDKIELLRAHPQHPGDRLGLVIREAPFALWFAHRLILKPKSLKPSWLSYRPNGRGRSGSARTRRTCDRPFPR